MRGPVWRILRGEVAMRKVQECQFGLGQTPIGEIGLDPKSRDDIPAVLKGLQLLYEERRSELWALLEAGVCPDADHRLGRPGMELWRILVLGVLKQGLDCDFDRLHELANQHRTVRAMLGHGDFDVHEYQYQTVVDNVSLLTPELLREVNRLVVETGHGVVKKKLGATLRGRCDSFVAKTNVRHPTDVGLLADAVRCMVREVARACRRRDVGGWRQHVHLTERAKRLARQVCTARQRERRPEAVGEYVDLCRSLAERTVESVRLLERAGAGRDEFERVLHWLDHVLRQVDQVERRLVKGEKIPHAEKVFSVFEPHTRWVSKGKAGNPVELGVPVCVVEDQYRFVLDWSVLWRGEDVHVAVPLIEAVRATWPDLRACSFDKGFHSPANRTRLDALLPDGNVLPQKGRLGKAAKARELEPAFVAARRRHPSVESGINHLQHHGLGRVRTRGAAGFARTVALSVLATNLHTLGVLLQRRERRALRTRRNAIKNGKRRRRRAA